MLGEEIIGGDKRLKEGKIKIDSKLKITGGLIGRTDTSSLGDSTSGGADEFLHSIEVSEHVALCFEGHTISAFLSKGSSFAKLHDKLHFNVSIVTLSPFSFLVKCRLHLNRGLIVDSFLLARHFLPFRMSRQY